MKFIRQAIMAALETDNESRARTLLLEFEDLDKEGGAILRQEVKEAYGLDL